MSSRIFRAGVIGFVAVFGLGMGTGCIVDASVEGTDDGGGNKKNVDDNDDDTLTRYEGTTVSDSVTYAAGDAVSIASDNGTVVVEAGTAGEITAAFTPFVLAGTDDEAGAVNEIESNLRLILNRSGGVITIEVVREDGSDGTLGADVLVSVPAELDGDFSANINNGSLVAALTTPASLDVLSDNGGVDVTLGQFAPGTIQLRGAGDVFLRLPAASDGLLVASTGSIGEVTDNSPEGWTVEETGEFEKTYTMGEGLGGQLDIIGGFDISIQGL